MLENYFKSALRQIWLFKIYSSINIIGLAIGLAACFIIYLYVSYQKSYDRYNEKLDKTFLVYSDHPQIKVSEPATPVVLGELLKNQFPEVCEIARWKTIKCNIKYGDKEFEEKNCVSADAGIFRILTLPVKAGNIKAMFSGNNSIAITENTAGKYFGKNNPLGEIISIDYYGSRSDYKIAAVLKDIPRSSTFSADFILPFSVYENFDKLKSDEMQMMLPGFSVWNYPSVNTYILLSPNTNPGDFRNKFDNFSAKLKTNEGNGKVVCRLFPVKDIYFHSDFMIHNDFPKGNVVNIYIYSTIALLIIFISITTLLMFSIGRASTRTKEMGVRQVIGARKIDLFKQILIESLAITFLALPLAVILIEVFLTEVNQLIGLDITSDYFHNWKYAAILFLTPIIVGVLSGTYAALFLCKIKPVDIFRNKMILGTNRNTFRRIMLAVQMVIVAGLIFGSLTIIKQLHYFFNKDFGFNKEQLVVFNTNYHYSGGNNSSKVETFKNELKKNNSIVNVTTGWRMPGSLTRSETKLGYQNFPKLLTKAELQKVEVFGVDKDFFETLQIEMYDGRSFNNIISSDSAGVCVINETAMRELGLKEPIGESILNKKIIGVVKDFNAHSLHEKIAPTVIILETATRLDEFAVRIRPGDMLNTIEFICNKFKYFSNNKPIGFQFFDDRLGEYYKEEQRFAKVIGFFTGLAIFVACLGLFGMSLFILQQRVKEIGIRKVLGASLNNILFLITKEFFVVTFISIVVAFPLTYYFVKQWLENFAYRVSIDFWIFFIGGFAAIMIVLATVSVQVIKAVIANPVKSLKYE